MITITPSLEELESMLQELKALLNHAEFQRATEDVLSVEPEQREQAFSTQLTPDVLKTKGVQISDRTNISLPTSETSVTSDTSNAADSSTDSAPRPEMIEPTNAKFFSDVPCQGVEVRVGNMTVCITVPFRRRFPPTTITQ